ncbi:MAG: methyltransferase domain-containing protein [Chloroflexota bacterium]|nr:methyltransferase domain-containing protein [Chloroflexota bacterium]
MPAWGWILVLVVALLVAAFYWLLVLTEGTFLGSRVVLALYDLYSVRYDRIKQFDSYDEYAFLARPLVTWFDETGCQSESGPLVLDVATGTGRYPIAVLRSMGAKGRVVGLDGSSGMLRQARKKLNDLGLVDVVLLKHDASQLPFASAAFEVVACLEALEFMPDPQRVIVELMRVLSPGGLLVVSNRIGRDTALMPGKAWSRSEFSGILTGQGASRVARQAWQVNYDLYLARKAGELVAGAERDWLDVLRCSRCTGSVEQGRGTTALCVECSGKWIEVDGIWESV